MTLAPKLPYTHPFAGGYPRVGGQPLPTDPDAVDYLSRVAAADGAAVEVGVAMAVDQFIKGCKADGIWDAIKASCILCGARTISGALVPLVGTAPTAYSFASGDYDRSSGLKGDGSTKYLDTNRAGNADGQNDRHVSVFTSDRGTKTGGARYIASGNSSSYDTFINNLSNSVVISSVSNNSYEQFAYSAAGFFGGNRSISTSFDFRFGGSTATRNRTSGTPNTENFGIFCRSIGPGDITFFSDARLAFYSIGSSLDLAALDTRVTQLVTGIKFHSLTGLVATDYDPDTVAYIVAAYEAGGTL